MDALLEQHRQDLAAFKEFQERQRDKEFRERVQGNLVLRQGIQPVLMGDHQGFASQVPSITQKAETGMVTYAPGVPLPPVNEHTVIAKNQIPVDYAPQVHPSIGHRTLVRAADDRPVVTNHQIALGRDFNTTSSNIPLIAMAINSSDNVRMSALMGSNEPTPITHVLNRRFTQNDDPYNQNGREFFNKVGNPTGGNRGNITTQHITNPRAVQMSNAQKAQMIGMDQGPLSAGEQQKRLLHDNGR